MPGGVLRVLVGETEVAYACQLPDLREVDGNRRTLGTTSLNQGWLDKRPENHCAVAL